MGFIKKAIDFIARPTHSRTMGLVIMLILITAVSLTVYVAQQQQSIKQRASEPEIPDCGNNLSCSGATVGEACSSKYSGYSKCLSAKGFGAAEKVNGKSVVCCYAQSYSLSDGVCTLSANGPFTTPSCTEPPTTLTSTLTPQRFGGHEVIEDENPILTPSFCVQSGGQCIGSYPCSLGKVQSNLSCGTSEVCCMAAPAPTPTPTPTKTPNLFTCINQTGPFAGNYQCAAVINGAAQCPTGYGVYSYDDGYTGTSCSANQGCCKQGATTQPNLFACQNQTIGDFAGNYTCADIVNEAVQCPNGYSNYNGSAPYTGTSCGKTRGCCKQITLVPTAIPATPSATLGPTSTPTPTPVPGSVQLVLTLAQQGLTSLPTIRNKTITVLVQRVNDQEIITKTGVVSYSDNAFRGIINLGVLPAGSYKFRVKMGKFLKSPTGNLTISGTTAAAKTIALAGLADQDNVLTDQDDIDAISFYNGLKACFGSTLGVRVKKCDSSEDVDLNGDANVDVIDYQIYLKGIRSLVLGSPVL